MTFTTHKAGRYTQLFGALLLGLLLIGCSKLSLPDEEVDIPVEITSKSALKLLIEETGVYRISAEELRSHGLGLTNLDYGKLSLTSLGEQVPLYIDGSHLVFYGIQSDSRYSRQRPYILRTNIGGIQMAELPAPTLTTPLIESVPQEVRVEQNYRYEQRAAEFGGEVWFWKRIVHSGDGAKFDVTIELPAVTAESAELRAHWWGLSYNDEIPNDHDLNVAVNGQSIGTVVFDGQNYHPSNTAMDGALLAEGENIITIDNSVPGASRVDQVYLDWVALHYTAPTAAIGDQLSVTERSGLLNASGFSGKPLAVEITDPSRPNILANWQFEGDSAELGIDEGMSVTLVGPDGYLEPVAYAPVIETTLRDETNQADLLIVTTRTLAPALEPLVAEREAQGLSVMVTMVDELYDTFSFGDETPAAINAYVKYAHENWEEPKPAYLFLVGDATMDTLGYAASNPENPIPQPRNLVPSPIVEVSFSGETVADARLADIDGDLTPDLAVGRWPVDTVNDVESLVERTLAYEKGVSAENAIFTFDASSNEFSHFTNNMLTESSFPQNNALLYSGPTSSQVLDTWNDGAWIVSYVGHGGLKLWGKDEILTKEAAADIESKDAPPIVLQFSCLTGHFAEFSTESITETMLKNDDGPVLLVASTSLTLSTHQSPFAIKLLSELQNPATERMGDAFQMAKDVLDINSSTGLLEISDTFGLIGDPSALIVRPATAAAEAQ